jgi:hypothetical protein
MPLLYVSSTEDFHLFRIPFSSVILEESKHPSAQINGDVSPAEFQDPLREFFSSSLTARLKVDPDMKYEILDHFFSAFSKDLTLLTPSHRKLGVFQSLESLELSLISEASLSDDTSPLLLKNSL